MIKFTMYSITISLFTLFSCVSENSQHAEKVAQTTEVPPEVKKPEFITSDELFVYMGGDLSPFYFFNYFKFPVHVFSGKYKGVQIECQGIGYGNKEWITIPAIPGEVEKRINYIGDKNENFEANASGNVTKRFYFGNVITFCEYDSLSRPILRYRTSDPEGYRVTYTYNDSDMSCSIVDNGLMHTRVIKYNEKGDPTHITVTSERFGNIEEEIEYNEKDLIVKQIRNLEEGKQVILYNYDFNEEGDWKTVTLKSKAPNRSAFRETKRIYRRFFNDLDSMQAYIATQDSLSLAALKAED